MNDIQVPHFDLPFRYKNGAPAVAEQDSLADVANCVQTIVMTEIGQRLEVPGFGIPSPVFQDQPIKLNEILTQINIFEPRADVLLDQHPEVVDAMIADISINVRTREV